MTRLPDVGESIGPYRLDREVARGGMGVVFEAADNQLGRKVAIKVISPVFAEDEEYRRRFIREASSLARADSPHIVQIYGYGDHGGCLYMAMQYVGGGDLRQAITDGPLSLADTLKIVVDVATGLADAHDVGVLHRDVKPRNVLLRPSVRRPHAYLCDFGVAKSDASQTTITGAVTGTLSYVAPEIFDGLPPTPGTDLYALGCLMWECLTGAPPYTGEVAQIIAGSVSGPIPQLVGDEPSVRQTNALLTALLAKKPAERITNAHDVSRRAQEILERTPRPAAGSPADPATDIHSRVTLLRAPTGPQAAAAPPARIPSSEEALTLARVGTTPGSTPGSVASAPARAPRSVRRSLVLVSVLVVLCLVGVGGAWALRTADGDVDDSTRARSTAPTTNAKGTASPGRDDPAPTRSTDSATPSAARAASLVIGDLTGDERGDLAVVAKDSNAVHVVPVNSGGPSVAADAARTERATESLQGDFDGDGTFDVAALTSAGEAWVTNGWDAAEGRLSESRLWSRDVPAVSTTVSSGDFNGDGRWDLALTSVFSQRLRSVVMLSDGASFGAPVAWLPRQTAYTGTPRFIAGDFTGDGLHDLVEVDDLGGRSDLRLLRSTGDGFGPAERWYAQTGWTTETMRPVTGDFNGDSRADLAVVENVTGEPQIHLLTSSGSGFDDVGTTPLGSGFSYTVPVASDVDGDGTTDLVAVTPGPSYRVLAAGDTVFSGSPVVDVTGVAAGFAVIGRGTFVEFD